MSSLRDLFESLALERLTEWVSQGQQEDLRLDFKILAGGSTLNRDDRRNLTEAVSGFANSDGGLIVWGVDCRKNTEGVDAAIALKPIEGVAAVLSQLREHPGQVTSPVVDGVEHRQIAGQVSGTGFLVTLVPRSDRGPHMAADKRYYKRNGASFLKMEHFDVADMFGKRQRPDVRLKLTYRKDPSSSDEEHRYHLFAKLKNHGRARAHDIKAVLTMPQIVFDKGVVNHQSMRELVHFQTNAALFPGDERDASFNGTTYLMNENILARFEEDGWPQLTLRIFQDDSQPTEEHMSFEDLQKF